MKALIKKESVQMTIATVAMFVFTIAAFHFGLPA